MEPKKPKLRIIVKSLNLYNRLCTVLPKDEFRIDYDTFSPYEVYIMGSTSQGATTSFKHTVDDESTYHNLQDNEIYPYIAGKFGLKVSCSHDVIDNGTRVSECRKCSMRMELFGWDWKESPRHQEPMKKDATAPKVDWNKRKAAHLANIRLVLGNHGYSKDELNRRMPDFEKDWDKEDDRGRERLYKKSKAAALSYAYGASARHVVSGYNVKPVPRNAGFFSNPVPGPVQPSSSGDPDAD